MDLERWVKRRIVLEIIAAYAASLDKGHDPERDVAAALSMVIPPGLARNLILAAKKYHDDPARLFDEAERLLRSAGY